MATVKKRTPQQRIVSLDRTLREDISHLVSWWNRESDFIEMRLMTRDDGTILCIAKGYGEDGTPMVAFGSGYGVIAGLLALNASLAANSWRVDKPWSERKQR